MRILIICCTIAAAVACATAGVAISRDSVKSHLTLENTGPGVYKGKVGSGVGACRKGRRVTVRHDEDGNGYSLNDYRIGSDRTDADGDYKVTGNQAPSGDWIAAKVSRKSFGEDGTCKSDTARAKAQ